MKQQRWVAIEIIHKKVKQLRITDREFLRILQYWDLNDNKLAPTRDEFSKRFKNPWRPEARKEYEETGKPLPPLNKDTAHRPTFKAENKKQALTVIGGLYIHNLIADAEEIQSILRESPVEQILTEEHKEILQRGITEYNTKNPNLKVVDLYPEYATRSEEEKMESDRQMSSKVERERGESALSRLLRDPRFLVVGITALFFIIPWLVSLMVVDPYVVETQTIDGVVMVKVPSGCFQMGHADGNEEFQANVIKEQCVDSFWIDRYEVSNDQFGDVDTGTCDFLIRQGEIIDQRAGGDEPDRARNCVLWTEAVEYCAKRGARLPTEVEWEFAARSPEGRIYPWGNEFFDDHANVRLNDISFFVDSVFAYPEGESWIGARNMTGGVREWTSTIYDLERFPYPYDADDGRENPEDTTSIRVLKGGSWDGWPEWSKTFDRGDEYPDFRWNTNGFRCVKDV